jgi:hypothetical protein
MDVVGSMLYSVLAAIGVIAIWALAAIGFRQVRSESPAFDKIFRWKESK